MILSSFRFALRNISRNKLLASINVLGLTIGISACMAIFLIANFELSYDRFHEKGDRIYRIYSKFNGVYSGTNPGLATGVAKAIQEQVSGIEASTHFITVSQNKVFVPQADGQKKMIQGKSVPVMVDPDYFDVIHFNTWMVGSPESLSAPGSVVLTEGQARMYFGDMKLQEMIGRPLTYGDSLQVSVTGILADVDERTDFQFTDFISKSTNALLSDNQKLFVEDDWNSTNSNSQLFVRLASGVLPAQIDGQMEKVKAIYKEKNKDAEWNMAPMLQPLSDMHFNTAIGIFDFSRSVSERSTFYVLIAVALLLLVIAVINFVNLETAQASRRAKEVGVRKVLGSARAMLIAHFMIESFLLTLFAVLCSLGLTWLSLHWFSEFIPPGVTLDLTEPAIQIFFVSTLIVVSLLAGIYPAFVLSSFQPALALKNLASATSGMSRSSFIRKSLTVFQFSFSQVLILATVAIGLQVHHMLSRDLGFTSEAVIQFYTPFDQPVEKRLVLANELERVSAIELMSAHGTPPSWNGYSSSVMEYDNGKEVVKYDVFQKTGDHNYLNLYRIKLLAGRNIREHDSVKHILINETFMKKLGFASPHDALGKTISKEKIIVGVVADFNTQSLHNPIKPTVIYNRPGGYACFGIRFARNSDGSVLQDQIESVEKAFKSVYPDSEFNYTFVDDAIRRFYETEERMGKLSRTATAVAILISCLGLFGLSSFTVIQRTKEIGIRKVLGASVSSILLLLSFDFLKLVVIAFAIAAPVAYFIIEDWLSQFAYRMDVAWWLFAVAGSASLAIAFVTISFRSIKAAKANPVKSLRYE